MVEDRDEVPRCLVFIAIFNRDRPGVMGVRGKRGAKGANMKVQPVDNFSGSKDLVEPAASAACDPVVATSIGEGGNGVNDIELVGPVRPRGHRQRGEPRKHRGKRLLAMQLVQRSQPEQMGGEPEGPMPHRSRRRGAVVPSETMAQLRGLALSKAMDRLGLYHARDREYLPAKDSKSVRVHVSVEATVVELIITGQTWFDTRAAKGGRGCVDLAMHLLQVDFVQAVAMLTAQGSSSTSKQGSAQ